MIITVLLLLFAFMVAVFILGVLIGASMDASRSGTITASAILSLFVGLITFLCAKPWAFVDNYELGYKYDSRTGQIEVLQHTGYVSRTPFFENVHTIDLRPRQVCINVNLNNNAGSNGANQRVLNCKLVKFDPKGLNLFLSWHGRGDYNGSSLDDLLKIYAYDGSGRAYPFLDVLRELKNDDGANNVIVQDNIQSVDGR